MFWVLKLVCSLSANNSSLVPCLVQGLALINGTQMISSLGAEAVERAAAVARQADIVAALTLEALSGTKKAFHKGAPRSVYLIYPISSPFYDF